MRGWQIACVFIVVFENTACRHGVQRRTDGVCVAFALRSGSQLLNVFMYIVVLGLKTRLVGTGFSDELMNALRCAAAVRSKCKRGSNQHHHIAHTLAHTRCLGVLLSRVLARSSARIVCVQRVRKALLGVWEIRAPLSASELSYLYAPIVMVLSQYLTLSLSLSENASSQFSPRMCWCATL